MMEATDEQGRDSAAADGSISSVLNSALKHVNEFFMRGGEFTTKEANKVSYEFCQSVASRGGANGMLGDSELNDVLGDIDVAHTAIVGAKAARFVASLLDWPGVSESLEAFGGWKSLEIFGGYFDKLNLSLVTKDEAHFSLLSNVSELKKMLGRKTGEMEKAEKVAKRTIANLWIRFKLGSMNASSMKRNPNLACVRQMLVDGNTNLTYPSLANVEEEEEGEEESY